MLWGWNDKEHDVIEVDHLLRCAHTLAITVVAVAAAVAAAVSTALFFAAVAVALRVGDGTATSRHADRIE